MGKHRIIGCLLISLLWIAPEIVSAENFNFRVLDVGEGQSILMHRNRHAILVDTGHAGMAASVLKRMKTLGIQQLDYLILTHLHPDHASGYFQIHEQYPQAKTLDNCYPLKVGSSEDIMRWVDEALKQNPNRICVMRGYKFEWQGSEIEVLWPDDALSPQLGHNHNSLVLQVSLADKTLLLMGDADEKAEAKILNHKPFNPVDILVVGHHGAGDASSEDFLRSVSPQYSIISINRNNFRGYPSPRTLNRLTKYSGKVLKTYESGEVHFVFE